MMLSLHLHTLLHCTICTEKYNETNRRPKLLHCGHTFCLTCLEKLFSGILLLPSYTRNLALKCPNCRQTTEMFDACYVPRLSDNFVIINFLTSEESCKYYCKRHQDEKVEIFCHRCQRLLCPSCALQHMAQKLHKTENVESAALKYRQQIYLAISDCKEKQKRLNEIIQEAELEKLKLERLSKSLENIVTNANDLELLFHKPILKKLKKDYSVNSVICQNVSLGMRMSKNKKCFLSPPAYWCTPHPDDRLAREQIGD